MTVEEAAEAVGEKVVVGVMETEDEVVQVVVAEMLRDREAL